MRNSVRYSLAALSSLFCVLFIFIGSCISVSVIPNESVIEGVVSEYAIVSSRLVNVSPEQTLYRLTVHVESTDTIGGGPDFLAERIGRDVQFYSKENISPDIFGRSIKAKVTFRGDERGGMFWIRDVQLKKEGNE